MQRICVLLLLLLLIIIITILVTTYAKDYSAIELNRLRMKELYRDHILLRPLMKSSDQITVAAGIEIIEVGGIDLKTQVCIHISRSICVLYEIEKLIQIKLINFAFVSKSRL